MTLVGLRSLYFIFGVGERWDGGGDGMGEGKEEGRGK